VQYFRVTFQTKTYISDRETRVQDRKDQLYFKNTLILRRLRVYATASQTSDSRKSEYCDTSPHWLLLSGVTPFCAFKFEFRTLH
jgi:hypothetical protein